MSGVNPSTSHLPGTVPLWAAGKEPLPPGLTEEDRPMWEQNKKMEKFMAAGIESCPAKTLLAGGAGFGIGAFFSLMSASFAYEDPYLRQQTRPEIGNAQKARQIFKEMGKGMYSSGKSFGKIGALFAGVECIIESYRAKNDIYNSVSAGFFAGGILARNSGPKGAISGGLAFAAFSAAIDLLFIRREASDED
ncbi:Tim17/Tim22/Tim23/Pmp24 family-domain-containing protein [Crepidotus variabilis]|uniref:Mitochondrial import inner membrane translocase subunit TIM22 n=1 Tax=Crepidotus variabilis TaxID=179855 RepID=A0A9P6EHE6_9AGAR|nr:Tim17/Tim22/Tim23/Pmp24 family-domain-containing protein [Crepidotus variabilis]